MHVVRCRAVQRLTARKMIIAARRVATLNGAENLSTVRLKDRSFGPVLSLDPLDIAVHMFAWAERCRAVLLMWWGWGGGRPTPEGSKAVRMLGFGLCPSRPPSEMRRRQPNPHPCWAAVPVAVQSAVPGGVRGAVQSWELHLQRIVSHSSSSDTSAHGGPLPLPCLLCQCPGLQGRCCASSGPGAAVRCGAGSPEPRAAWRSRCGVP